MTRNRIATAIAIFLTVLMTFSMMLLPTASAHSPPWQIPTHAFVVAAPDPVGVGQTVHVFMFLAEIFGTAGGATPQIGTNGSTASAALLSNNYRFRNYKLTITAPDGTKTTQTFDVIWDTTSSQFTTFTPSTAGTYTFNFTFPGQAYAQYEHYEKSVLVNDTYLPSSASTTLTVQQEPIPAAINSFPLPSAYWTHPIYGENTDWWAISSNWLGSGASPPQGYVGTANAALYHPDTIGPLTSHVMWTRPLQFGGLVGGDQYFAGGTYPGTGEGVMYYEGSAYQPRFYNPIIISGYLFYAEPSSFTGPSSGPVDCIDLRTGQVLWSRTDIPPLSFGYIYNLWDPDQHGTFPPILVAVNSFTGNWQLYDAYTGDSLFNVTNIPSSTPFVGVSPNVAGPSGEQLRYVFANAGNASNPQWYLAQWNSSKLWQYDINPYAGGGSLSPSIINASNRVLIPSVPIPLLGVRGTLPTGGTTIVPRGSTLLVDANIPINSTTTAFTGTAGYGITTYDWNISVPWLNTMPPPYATISGTGQMVQPQPGAIPVSILAVKWGDVMLCRNGSLPVGFGANRLGYPQLPYTYFTVNLNASKGAIGSVNWMKTYSPPADNATVLQAAVDFETRVFILYLLEDVQWQGYNLDNGDLLWTTPPENAWNYYYDPGQPVPGTVAYGRLYNHGFGGILYCYDVVTGELLWTYGNDGEGNSTKAGLATPYGVYPTQIQSIANGVVYTATDEHTIPNPLFKGAVATAINATDGTEIWKLSLYPSEWTSSAAPQWATADGFITAMNGYDNNIYSIGRGPSATTVTAPNIGLSFGAAVVIRGTVLDTSAGTKQAQQAADFPNGVPCASDASMEDWMGHVYQQKPLPTDFTGVEVTISVLDSNNNYRTIGTATTDATGMYSLTWAPDIPGDFTVVATFPGTYGYWPSYSRTTFAVMEAPEATASPTQPPASMADLYFLPVSIGMIIAIVVVIILVLLGLLKKR